MLRSGRWNNPSSPRAVCGQRVLSKQEEGNEDHLLLHSTKFSGGFQSGQGSGLQNQLFKGVLSLATPRKPKSLLVTDSTHMCRTFFTQLARWVTTLIKALCFDSNYDRCAQTLRNR